MEKQGIIIETSQPTPPLALNILRPLPGPREWRSSPASGVFFVNRLVCHLFLGRSTLLEEPILFKAARLATWMPVTGPAGPTRAYVSVVMIIGRRERGQDTLSEAHTV